MSRIINSLLSLVLVVALTLSLVGSATADIDYSELDDDQRNALAMLNYIIFLTQEITEEQNSRIYLENIKSEIRNNTYPNAVDGDTLAQLTGLMDRIDSFRLIREKRDRLQYIYEQSQARAILSSIPNPLGLLDYVQSFSPEKMAMSVLYMAVDSATSYRAYSSQAEQEFLQDGWVLDDMQAAELNDLLKDMFIYRVIMVKNYGIPGDLTIKEDAVTEFVEHLDDDVASRIKFLESKKSTYQSYGGYWLALAKSYYENGDYQKCIDSVASYRNMGVRIFMNDYDLAKVLPLAITSASKVYGIEEYEPYAVEHVNLLLKNIDSDDWAFQFFAAQILVDLYAQTQNKDYLLDAKQGAYHVLLNSINNHLKGEQLKLNKTYLLSVQEISVPKGTPKAEKNPIIQYNTILKETRKTEMPPIYEPLVLTLDLLFSIADELDPSRAMFIGDDNILHPNGERLFLAETIDNLYWFDLNHSTINPIEIDLTYSGPAMIVPARYLTRDASIIVTVVEPGDTEPFVIHDWKIDKVARGKDGDPKQRTIGDIETFEVAYSSELAAKHTWVPDSKVLIDIILKSTSTLHFEFKTEGTKNVWYDYLMPWKGLKNNWYDYLKVWENSVIFNRVA